MEMPDKCEADEAKKDAVIWSIGVREDLSIDSVINSLMDASKGYIDGTLEAIRANIENRSVTASLPDYVLNDLKKNINFEADSYLDFNSFCDYSMFFPTLDRALSFVYYHALLVYY